MFCVISSFFSILFHSCKIYSVSVSPLVCQTVLQTHKLTHMHKHMHTNTHKETHKQAVYTQRQNRSSKIYAPCVACITVFTECNTLLQNKAHVYCTSHVNSSISWYI